MRGIEDVRMQADIALVVRHPLGKSLAQGGTTRKYKEDDWQDLKLDGWIGPKTEEAYSTIASLAEPDEIAASFGRSLRFI